MQVWKISTKDAKLAYEILCIHSNLVNVYKNHTTNKGNNIWPLLKYMRYMQVDCSVLNNDGAVAANDNDDDSTDDDYRGLPKIWLMIWCELKIAAF